MAKSSGERTRTSEGIVSGFVDRETVRIVSQSIIESAVAGLAADLLAFWPMPVRPVVIALFEDRSHFEVAAARFAAFGAAGAAVIVGFPGDPSGLPPGVHGVDLIQCEDLIDAWALVVIEGTFTAALVAVDTESAQGVASAADTDIAYSAKWTFRRDRVADAAKQLLRPMRPMLEPSMLDVVEEALTAMVAIEVTDGESRLLQVLESFGASLVRTPILAPVNPGTTKLRSVESDAH